MAHIKLPEDAFGISGPMRAYPDTARPLNLLAQTLLTKETPILSKADREAIASYVSFLNECVFCSESHAAVADHHYGHKSDCRLTWRDPDSAPISETLKALLVIARKVTINAKSVNADDVAKAQKLGATDEDIHDTVLIAAAFCMFNRYVDGLNTTAPERGDVHYQVVGERLAEHGYINSIN